MTHYTTCKLKKSSTLFGLGSVGIKFLPRKGVFRGVFLANHLASTDNMSETNKRQNTIQTQTTAT